MKRIANALIIVGVGVVSFLILYSSKVSRFNNIEASIILFFTGVLIISGILLKTITNMKIMSREKFYSRIIIGFMVFTIITYNLIKSFI